MSFSAEFYAATPQDAHRIVEKEHIPQSVKDFIYHALAGIPSNAYVYVKAYGHLFQNDYAVSTAEIKVHEIAFRKAPPMPERDLANAVILTQDATAPVSYEP